MTTFHMKTPQTVRPTLDIRNCIESVQWPSTVFKTTWAPEAPKNTPLKNHSQSACTGYHNAVIFLKKQPTALVIDVSNIPSKHYVYIIKKLLSKGQNPFLKCVQSLYSFSVTYVQTLVIESLNNIHSHFESVRKARNGGVQMSDALACQDSRHFWRFVWVQ